MAERDRYREALERIADPNADWIGTTPQLARIAQEALDVR